MARPYGYVILASVAGPPSPMSIPPPPTCRYFPVPTTVDMNPSVSTRRTTLLFRSAMYSRSEESIARPEGNAKCALTAGPPSPRYASIPTPATVVTMPVSASILLTRCVCASAKNRLPVESIAKPSGCCIVAAVAGPPSPLNPLPPVPAIVSIVPVEASTRRIRRFPVSEM